MWMHWSPRLKAPISTFRYNINLSGWLFWSNGFWKESGLSLTKIVQTDDEVEEVAGVLIEVYMWAKDHKARISDFKRAHCPAEPKNLEQQTQIVLYR